MSIFDRDLDKKKHIINADSIRSAKYKKPFETLPHEILDEIIENVLKYIFYRVRVGADNSGIFEKRGFVTILCEVFGVDGSIPDGPQAKINDHPNIVYVIKEFEDLGFEVTINDNKLNISWDDSKSIDGSHIFTSAQTITATTIDANTVPVQPMSALNAKLMFMDMVNTASKARQSKCNYGGI